MCCVGTCLDCLRILFRVCGAKSAGILKGRGAGRIKRFASLDIDYVRLPSSANIHAQINALRKVEGVLAVRHEVRSVSAVVARLAALIAGTVPITEKRELVAAIAAAVPGFQHVETGRSLDQRM